MMRRMRIKFRDGLAKTPEQVERKMFVRLIFQLTLLIALAGCAASPDPGCAKHHCDPSIDEQFKRNASWDARTPDEYAKLPAKN